MLIILCRVVVNTTTKVSALSSEAEENLSERLLLRKQGIYG